MNGVGRVEGVSMSPTEVSDVHLFPFLNPDR